MLGELVLVIAIAACSPDTVPSVPIAAPASQNVILSGANGTAVTLKLIHDGTLSTARADDPGPSGTLSSVITATVDPEDPRVVRVTLTLGPCSPAPTLAIGNHPDRLQLRLDPGDSSQTTCPAIGIPFGLTLTFSQKITGRVEAFGVVNGQEIR
jgi:hypothetical protein